MDAALASAIKATLGNYPLIRDAYYQGIFEAVYSYLDGDGAVTKFRNDMKKALTAAFFPAAEAAWQDAGAELPIDQDLTEWLVAAQDAEFAYIDSLFQTLKEARKGEDVKKAEIAQARADGYTATLDRIYNYAKVKAAGNKMLTFVGDDGVHTCADCARYKNKRHKASWWIEHNAVPPNRDFECHGYFCAHVLADDSGKVWTL